MNLSAFLAENVKSAEEIEYIASTRFTEKDGKPAVWKLKGISAEEDRLIRRDCTRAVPVPGRKGHTRPDFDYNLYIAKLATACTVYPNLNSAELLNGWKARNPEELLGRMLKPGEFNDYAAKAQELCGFETMQELVDEAKN